MKKLLLVILTSILFCVCTYANEINNPFPLFPNPILKGGAGGSENPGYSGGNDGDEGENPGKGHRAPARPAFCSIDFDAAEVHITGYDSADIETFEICDAESHGCIFATDECAEFVAELAQTNEPVLVVFYFDGFTLSGYFAR